MRRRSAAWIGPGRPSFATIAVMPRRRHLIASSLIVIAFYGLSKVTGFGKLLLVTRLFGAGEAADAYLAANQLPELFYEMLSGGALAAALIPVYAGYLLRGATAERRAFANTAITLVLLGLAALCAPAALVAPWLARVVLVPEFSAANQQLTAELMRLLLIAMTIVGVSAAFSALLNAHQHFALPAFSTVVIDLGQIAGLWLLAPQIGILGAAWGSLLGALLHLGVQIPALVAHGIGWRPQLAWRLDGVRETLRLMGPRVATMGLVQAADLGVIRLASALPPGSLSGYYYALLVIILPGSLFGWAIGSVIFPTLAERHLQGDVDGARALAGQALRVLWALLIPSAVGLVLLGRPGVAFLFERGAFDPSATVLVHSLLIILAWRIPLDALGMVLERLFYARHDTRTPMQFYILWTAVYLGGAWLLSGRIGAQGLALAQVGASALLVGLLYLRNRRVMGSLEERQLAGALGRIGLATAGMALVIGALHRLELPPLWFAPLAAALGAAVYFTILWLSAGRPHPARLWSAVSAGQPVRSTHNA